LVSSAGSLDLVFSIFLLSAGLRHSDRASATQRRAFWARPIRGEFASKGRGCPIAVAYLAYLARKSAKNIDRPKSNTDFFSHGGHGEHRGGTTSPQMRGAGGFNHIE